MKKKLKVVAMIPARLGSKRVPKKNLRLLGNKPLISYVVETAIKSDVFDEVYINSEAKVFSAIADELGASFYQRSEALASDETNNDQFLLDFCEHVDADIVVQILPTSPFLTVDEVRSFVNKMLGKSLDTLVSTVDHQIACVFKDSPVNFSKIEPHISSQNMAPVSSYATVLMAWRREFFLDAMAKYGFGYHGADGKTDYFSLEGFSTVDIDNEHDFLFAEAVYEYLSKPSSRLSEPRYYTGHAHAEFDVPSILKIDGIDYFDFKNENCPLSNIKSIISSMDNSRSWCYRVVNSESNSATLISQLPGEGNRRHYHPDWNEWWYIIAGCWQWDVENESFVVNSGDIVFIEKGKWHKITALGDVPAIRLAVSRADVLHVYE